MAEDAQQRNGRSPWAWTWLTAMLGTAAAGAIAWNYTQLDTIRITNAENNALLKVRGEDLRALKSSVESLEAAARARELRVQEIKSDEEAMKKRLDNLELRVFHDGPVRP